MVLFSNAPHHTSEVSIVIVHNANFNIGCVLCGLYML